MVDMIGSFIPIHGVPHCFIFILPRLRTAAAVRYRTYPVKLKVYVPYIAYIVFVVCCLFVIIIVISVFRFVSLYVSPSSRVARHPIPSRLQPGAAYV